MRRLSARPARLKLARAYLRVGQRDDARICLAPLLAAPDDPAGILTADVNEVYADPEIIVARTWPFSEPR